MTKSRRVSATSASTDRGNQHMKRFIIAAMIVVSGCTPPPVITKGSTSYQGTEFGLAAIEAGRIALMPALAGAGVEAYRRSFAVALDDTLGALGKAYVPWGTSLKRINDEGLALAYGDAIATYTQTSIIDRPTLIEIGRACEARFLIVVTLATPHIERQDIRVSVYAQVWDSVTGDVVWEGIASSEGAPNLLSSSEERQVQLYKSDYCISRAMTDPIQYVG